MAGVGFKSRATAQRVKALADSAVRRSAVSGLLLPDAQTALHVSANAILAYTLEDIPGARLRSTDLGEEPVEKFRGKFIVCSSVCEIYDLVRISDGAGAPAPLEPPRGNWTEELQADLDVSGDEFEEAFLQVVPRMRTDEYGDRQPVKLRVWNFWPSDVWAKKLIVVDKHRDAGVWYVLGEACVRIDPIPDPEAVT